MRRAVADRPSAADRTGIGWRVLVAILLAALVPQVQASASERPGRAGSDPTGRIVGGRPVAIGADAFMAHLRVTVGQEVRSCGGSLVDATHVLTAAHSAVGSVPRRWIRRRSRSRSAARC